VAKPLAGGKTLSRWQKKIKVSSFYNEFIETAENIKVKWI